MIGKILAGMAGAKAARNSGGSSAGGALFGIAGATLLRRLSLPAMIGLSVGGYALKKWKDRRDFESDPAPKATPANRKPPKTAARA